MKQKTLLAGAVLVTVFTLAGCFTTKNKIETKADFSVAACNDYVEFVKCVASKATNDMDMTQFDALFADWKKLSEAELNQQCVNAISFAIADADVYTQYGCELPKLPQEENNEVISEEDTLDDMFSGDTIVDEDVNREAPSSHEGEDLSVVQSISGEIDDSSGNVNAPSGISYETFSEDREIINSILETAYTGL